ELEDELRRAIDLDELLVHYQPIVDLASNRVVALEALVRWDHPTRGIVSPGDFIPLSEETGLITALGEKVLEDACLQGRRWRDIHIGRPALTISVNLSPRQLVQPDLIDTVERILETTGFDPSELWLEITESAIVEAQFVTRERLSALVDL